MTDRKSSTIRSRQKFRLPLVEALEGRALLSTAGTPDATYGTLGLATVQFGTGFAANSNVASEAIQSDGKVVAVGTYNSNVTENQPAVERLDSDGSPDPTFGQDGVAVIVDPNRSSDSNNGVAVAIQADGKIVVAENSISLTNLSSTIDVERLNSDGTLDTTFGTAGYLDFTFNQGTTALSSSVTTLAIQADGEIVVGGSGLTNPGLVRYAALARFNADGSPDNTFNPTFGSSGQIVLTQDVTPGFATTAVQGVAALAIQPDGGIVYDATTELGSLGTQLTVGRLTTAGRLDPTFGTGGQAQLGNGNQNQAQGAGLAIQPDGKIVVVGLDFSNVNHFLAIFRLDADGSSDTTFKPGGDVINTPNGNYVYSSADAVLVQPDGKIVLGGPSIISGPGTTILRLDPDGAPDVSFGTGGLEMVPPAITGSNGRGEVEALAIQADGKLLAAASNGILRLLATGAVNDFNNDGTRKDRNSRDQADPGEYARIDPGGERHAGRQQWGSADGAQCRSGPAGI